MTNKKEIRPRLVPCRQKSAECTDITENALLSPTWSCPVLDQKYFFTKDILTPSRHFDKKDRFRTTKQRPYNYNARG